MLINPFPSKKRNNNNEEISIKITTSSLVASTFFSMNEIIISQKIIQLPKYYHYFLPVIKNSFVNIAKIDSNRFETCEIVEKINPNQYILLTKYRPITQSFYEVFYNKNNKNSVQPDKKQQLLTIITSYQHLLKAAAVLNSANIVNLNMHPSNLVYVKSCSYPIIENLSQCFHIPSMNQERISNLFPNYNKKDVFLPIEAHIIGFLHENNLVTISYLHAEKLAEDYEKRLVSLSCLSDSFIKQYKENARFSLESCINMPRESIISLMLRSSYTWNLYGISILFLVLLRDNFKGGDYAFIAKFNNHLLENIHALPEKRLTSEQNMTRFNELLYDTTIDQYNDVVAL